RRPHHVDRPLHVLLPLTAPPRDRQRARIRQRDPRPQKTSRGVRPGSSGALPWRRLPAHERSSSEPPAPRRALAGPRRPAPPPPRPPSARSPALASPAARRAGPLSSSRCDRPIASLSRDNAPPVSAPFTLARYVRATPYRGCVSRLASSPSFVSRSNPTVS